MEKKVLDLLVEEGQILAEKRSWLKKGYQDLLEKLNGELANIPDISEKPIAYNIREFCHCPPNYHDSLDRKINVILIFEDDAFLQLRIGKEEDYWNYEDLDNPSIATIRAFAAQVPFFLSHFVDEIKKRNAENQDAIITIERLLKKLA